MNIICNLYFSGLIHCQTIRRFPSAVQHHQLTASAETSSLRIVFKATADRRLDAGHAKGNINSHRADYKLSTSQANREDKSKTLHLFNLLFIMEESNNSSPALLE